MSIDPHSMAAQRMAEFGKQGAQASDRLLTLHPDSPEAAVIREELQAKAEQLRGALDDMMKTISWQQRVVVMVVGWGFRLVLPIIGWGHRLYHMAKGLM